MRKFSTFTIFIWDFPKSRILIFCPKISKITKNKKSSFADSDRKNKISLSQKVNYVQYKTLGNGNVSEISNFEFFLRKKHYISEKPLLRLKPNQ
jgi:hypothetical protein